MVHAKLCSELCTSRATPAEAVSYEDFLLVPDLTGLCGAVNHTHTPNARTVIAEHPGTSKEPAIAYTCDEGAAAGATEVKAELGVRAPPCQPVKEESDQEIQSEQQEMMQAAQKFAQTVAKAGISIHAAKGVPSIEGAAAANAATPAPTAAEVSVETSPAPAPAEASGAWMRALLAWCGACKELSAKRGSSTSLGACAPC